MIIRKGDNSQLTKNFTSAEIFNAAFGLKSTDTSFTYSDKTINGAQAIRDYFGVPMKYTASFRTKEHDISKGRSGNGQHPKGNAGDLKFIAGPGIMEKYHQEILTQGPLFHKLRALGITGFGLYDGFLHIDSRPEGGKHKDNYGSYALWDERVTTKKNFSPLEAVDTYFNQNDEDKGADWQKTNLVLKIIAWVSVPTLLLILWYLIKSKKLKFKKS